MGLLNYTATIDEVIFHLIQNISEDTKRIFLLNQDYAEAESLDHLLAIIGYEILSAKTSHRELEEIQELRKRYQTLDALITTEAQLRSELMDAVDSFISGRTHPVLDFVRHWKIEFSEEKLLLEVTKTSAYKWSLKTHGTEIPDWLPAPIILPEEYIPVWGAVSDQVKGNTETQETKPEFDKWNQTEKSPKPTNELITLQLILKALAGLVDKLKDIEAHESVEHPLLTCEDDSIDSAALSRYLVSNIEGRIATGNSDHNTVDDPKQAVTEKTTQITTCIAAEAFANCIQQAIKDDKISAQGDYEYTRKGGYNTKAIYDYVQKYVLLNKPMQGQGSSTINHRLNDAKKFTSDSDKTGITANEIYSTVHLAQEQYFESLKRQK